MRLRAVGPALFLSLAVSLTWPQPTSARLAWRHYVNSDYGFAIDVPAELAFKENINETPKGYAHVLSGQVNLSPGGPLLSVSVAVRPDGTPIGEPQDNLDLIAGAGTRNSTEVLWIKPIFVGGYPGRDFQVRRGKVMLRTWAVAADARLILIDCVVTAPEAMPRECERLRSSLTITGVAGRHP
jgi:hypothetical protein